MFNKNTFIIPGILYNSYISPQPYISYKFVSYNHAVIFVEFWNYYYDMKFSLNPESRFIRYATIKYLISNQLGSSPTFDCVKRVNIDKTISLFEEFDRMPSAYIDYMLTILKFNNFESIPSILEKRSVPPYTSDAISARTLFDTFYKGPCKTPADICSAYLKYKLEEWAANILIGG